MAKEAQEKQRSRVGYGSSYRKGTRAELGGSHEIDAILNGQVWKVKPDEAAKAQTPCLWMETGVVDFKSCNNYYDCHTCKYDLGMRMKVEKGKQLSWQDAMRKRPELDRICRHSLTHRIARRACAYDYQCGTCDFDQFFEDIWSAKTKSTPTEVQTVKGFDLPMSYYFHDGHGWARIESGGFIRIGLDDFALKLLGEADALDLPLMGKELRQGVAGWGLKRRDNLADVLSPVDGIIVEVNSRVKDRPNMANEEPYGQGWLFLVRPPDIKKAVKTLKVGTESLDWMNGEIRQLEGMIEDVAGPLAADGGYLKADIFGNVPELGWEKLTRTFLKT